ncbi:succinate dehydrogenase/fumarate reductase iron-sulfur subunit [bacterium]|nr:succinate dehydrogenase/fumarate reductase iron-sulfur subunit [bacterium]
MSTNTLTFRIFRFKPGITDSPKFQDFEIAVTEEMSVLDALEKIRLEQDATLMYRHSCHHSSCGTCACKVNGKEQLTCTTNVRALETDIITVEPLAGFRKIGDLVVDMTGFYNDIPEEWDYLRPCEKVKSTGMPEGIQAFTRFENCIECGSCVSACPVSHADSPFMGPAAMAALHTEMQKSPEKQAELIAIAGGEHGERHCERAIDCSRVCPTQVSPARHILELRKKVAGK